jgi:hypothetical protein
MANQDFYTGVVVTVMASLGIALEYRAVRFLSCSNLRPMQTHIRRTDFRMVGVRS